MDSHKTAGVARVYVPNEYTVYLSGQDRGQPRGLRALARAGALRLPARARAPPQLRPADPPDGRLRDRRAAAPGRVRDPDAAGQAARPRGRGARARGRRATRWSTRRCASARRPQQAPSRRAARWSRPAPSSRSTTAATCSRGRGRRSAAPRTPSACCATPTSPAATPSCAASPPATGRSPTSARPTGSRSTAAASASTRLSPGDQVTLGTTTFTFDIEQ